MGVLIIALIVAGIPVGSVIYAFTGVDVAQDDKFRRRAAQINKLYIEEHHRIV